MIGDYPLTARIGKWYNKPKKNKKEIIPVTICVAAICANNTIFGASDRMLTAGDIQFQPQQQKNYQLCPSIVAQIAGDASIQASIINSLMIEIAIKLGANPNIPLRVSEVAERYCYYYDELKFRQAEHHILVPLGLNRDTWLAKQKDMESALVKNIASELMNYDFPHVAAIISGIDPNGTHIYLIRDGVSSCQDTVGFAAIGAGEWHASSQFMFAGHTRFNPMSETLQLVYSAKKRAEVAPGVGEATDMFAIAPGGFILWSQEDLAVLQGIYQEEQKCHTDASNTSKIKVGEYVKRLIEQAREAAQKKAEDVGGGQTPPGEKLQAVLKSIKEIQNG